MAYPATLSTESLPSYTPPDHSSPTVFNLTLPLIMKIMDNDHARQAPEPFIGGVSDEQGHVKAVQIFSQGQHS
jgi:pantothenate kinase-related protein Tda10